jgi:excinuclease UvrABC helicase subunit UvrB
VRGVSSGGSENPVRPSCRGEFRKRRGDCRITGLGFRFDSKIDTRDLKREQAERKAKKLVALVQGTSGLEGQAVDEESVESMVEQTTHELLTGSKRKLWSEE